MDSELEIALVIGQVNLDLEGFYVSGVGTQAWSHLPGHVDWVGGGYESGGDLLHGQAPEDADVCDVMALLPAPGSSLSTRFSEEMESERKCFLLFLKRFWLREECTMCTLMVWMTNYPVIVRILPKMMPFRRVMMS